MLKSKTISTTNGNGNGRLPKASDFKMPKNPNPKTTQFVEAGRAVLDALQKERENAQKTKK